MSDGRPDNAPVSYTLEGEIALIAVDNPPVNALSQAVRAGLQEAIERFEADTAAKVAVILGTGRTFIAGADIREFGKPMAEPFLPAVIQRIEDASKPVVAALHGTALGGGLEVALGCHARVMLASGKVGLPEVTLGILPGAGARNGCRALRREGRTGPDHVGPACRRCRGTDTWHRRRGCRGRGREGRRFGVCRPHRVG